MLILSARTVEKGLGPTVNASVESIHKTRGSVGPGRIEYPLVIFSYRCDVESEERVLREDYTDCARVWGIQHSIHWVS